MNPTATSPSDPEHHSSRGHQSHDGLTIAGISVTDGDVVHGFTKAHFHRVFHPIPSPVSKGDTPQRRGPLLQSHRIRSQPKEAHGDFVATDRGSRSGFQSFRPLESRCGSSFTLPWLSVGHHS